MLLTLVLLIYSVLHLSNVFRRRNKYMSGSPLPSSQAKDLISHHWNQGSAAAESMHRHIKLMVQKNIHIFTSQWPLSSEPWGLQHPPLPVSQRGRKMAFCRLFLNTPCSCMQCRMQCRMQHLVFSCSAWQKVAGPQKVFRIWIPTHLKRSLFLSRFWKLVQCYWTALSSQLLSVLKNPPAGPACACCWILSSPGTH